MILRAVGLHLYSIRELHAKEILSVSASLTASPNPQPSISFGTAWQCERKSHDNRR